MLIIIISILAIFMLLYGVPGEYVMILVMAGVFIDWVLDIGRRL